MVDHAPAKDSPEGEKTVEVVASVGTFDGVHRGHRSVLELIAKLAEQKNMQPRAFTFAAHPLALIEPSREPETLTPLWKKKKLIEESGVLPVVVDFNDELRNTTARQWMQKLHDEYGVKVLVMGYDHTFGNDGVNLSLEDYKTLGEETGIEVVIGDEIKGVSSSAIRKAVKAGDMEKAREMLGRPYSITSKVVKGNQLGHTLGFPTANIKIEKGIALPKPGVYSAIVKTLYDGKKHPAMVNVGVRPTVMRGDKIVVEAHLIDWKGDLYDKDITVRFLKRMRDEKKFESIDALKQQLAKDRLEVKEEVKF